MYIWICKKFVLSNCFLLTFTISFLSSPKTKLFPSDKASGLLDELPFFLHRNHDLKCYCSHSGLKTFSRCKPEFVTGCSFKAFWLGKMGLFKFPLTKFQVTRDFRSPVPCASQPLLPGHLCQLQGVSQAKAHDNRRGRLNTATNNIQHVSPHCVPETTKKCSSCIILLIWCYGYPAFAEEGNWR